MVQLGSGRVNRTVQESIAVVVCDGCGAEGNPGAYPRLPEGWSRYSIDRYTETSGPFHGQKALLELCPPCEPRLFEHVLRDRERWMAKFHQDAMEDRQAGPMEKGNPKAPLE